MKARTLVLILGIMLMSCTGFGKTTPDLTENSKADLVQVDLDVSVSVVSEMPVMVQDHSVVTVDIQSDVQAAEIFIDAQASFILSKDDALVFNPEISDRDRDVGWQDNRMNYETTLNPQNTSLHFSARTPRDGIRYGHSFLFS